MLNFIATADYDLLRFATESANRAVPEDVTNCLVLAGTASIAVIWYIWRSAESRRQLRELKFLRQETHEELQRV